MSSAWTIRTLPRISSAPCVLPLPVMMLRLPIVVSFYCFNLFHEAIKQSCQLGFSAQSRQNLCFQQQTSRALIHPPIYLTTSGRLGVFRLWTGL